MQVIAGNALNFKCEHCRRVSECEPTYGIFVCGDCLAHVCYAYRTSELIKCTKCGTINKVPKEPHRKVIKKKKLKSIHLMKKEQKEQKEQNEQKEQKEPAEQFYEFGGEKPEKPLQCAEDDEEELIYCEDDDLPYLEK